MTRADKLEGIVVAVRKMREHQRAFFRGDRSQERLNASRAAEREVDQMVKRLDEEDAAERQGRLL